jgi:hypothetical protein
MIGVLRQDAKTPRAFLNIILSAFATLREHSEKADYSSGASGIVRSTPIWRALAMRSKSTWT